MHVFVWEYRLGRGCAYIAQLDDSLAVWRNCVSSLRARQASRSRLTTTEGNGGLSELFEPLYYRKIDHIY